MKALLLTICLSIPVLSQQVSVSKQNKTITISAEQTMKFEPEIARLEIGCQDYAARQEEAFAATKNAIANILESLHRNGVEDQAITTESLSLEQQTESDSSRPLPTNEKFHSSQKLEVAVSIRTAQKILDSAVLAGANDVGNPQWLLKDYDLAQARTAGAALKKARTNAEQMAAGLGAKLGDLVYASNNVPSLLFALRPGLVLNTATSNTIGGAPRTQELKLFPQPVEVKATVYATFALE